ncbi:MAG: PPC domain-containing DNA-binding protein [Candidatus Thorarchaeota archaeon]|jgi:predicted DNA-binding protein with PD1-like motif
MVSIQFTSPTETIVARMEPGEDILETLETLVVEHDVRAGHLSLIGAVSKATLGYFDRKSNEYKSFILDEDLEVTSCIGNIARLENGSPVVHAHIAVADEEGKTFSGHLMKGCEVSVTIEVVLTILDGELTRGKDPTTGLNLLQLK